MKYTNSPHHKKTMIVFMSAYTKNSFEFLYVFSKNLFILTSLITVFPQSVSAAACSFPRGGNYTLTGACNITADSVDGVDEAGGSEASSANTAVLTVDTGATLTIPSGVSGTSILAVGSIELTGGTLVIGSSNAQTEIGKPIFVEDVDADGWPDSLSTSFNATSSGRRRRSLMRAMTLDCDTATFSEGNSCGSSDVVRIANAGSSQTDYDVLVEIDTAAAILAGNMTADCGDIRAYDTDHTTPLDYWIEGGCDTATTQIWITVPSIPAGNTDIFLDYDGSTTTDGEQTWSDTFLTLNDVACPSGWTSASGGGGDYENRFLYGSATYGTQSGSASHNHSQISCSTGTGSSTSGRTGGGRTYSTSSHSHSSARVDVSTNSSVYPPYLNMIVCSNQNLDLKSGQITLFDATVPSGWTRFSALDSTFPRGASTYGGTGGGTTHTHSTSGGYATGLSGKLSNGNYIDSPNSVAANHSHTSSSGTSGAGNSLPAYINMIFGEINSDGFAEPDTILMSSAIPPLGWTRFTATDSKYIRGASTYGSTGGTNTHTHSVTVSMGQGNSGVTLTGTGGGYAHRQHGHSCSATSSSSSNTPPYTQSILIQRNDPAGDSITTSVNP